MKRAHAGQTRLGWMYVAIGLAGVVVGLEITMVYSALATFYKSFADPAHVVWIITTHFLFYASSAALCGGLGDIFGRKWVLLIVLAVVSMASLTSAFAPSLAVLILGRGLQGVSGAVLPLCFGIIRELVPKEKMSMPIGIASTVPSVTGALGLVLGGVIVDHFSWRAIFCVSSGVTILALAAVAACVPSTARREHSGALDILGGVLFVPAVGGILLSISQSKSWGWADHRTLALLGGGIAIMLAWIRHELRQSNPLIDVRLFCNRQIALTNACMALVAVGALQYSQVLLLILQQPSWTGVGMGLSGTLMGLVMLPKVLFDLSCGPWTGYMVSSRGTPRSHRWRHAGVRSVDGLDAISCQSVVPDGDDVPAKPGHWGAVCGRAEFDCTGGAGQSYQRGHWRDGGHPGHRAGSRFADGGRADDHLDDRRRGQGPGHVSDRPSLHLNLRSHRSGFLPIAGGGADAAKDG
jgi:MFS family permease